MRRIVLATVVSALLTPAAAAADSQLSYSCYSPPQSSMPVDCSAWNTSPVRLSWSWDTTSARVSTGNCNPQIIRKDTAGLAVTCVIEDALNDPLPPRWTASGTATIRLDATAPTITSLAPARPPDYDGWWNHPVALAFQGSDATSGIAACSSTTYSGPDSAAAQVTGTCRDVAGNASTRSFPVKYDATPPTLSALKAARLSGRIALRWSPSADAVRADVWRSPGSGGAAQSVVYSGPAKTFTDRSVRVGKMYAYSVTVYDEAGNSASRTAKVRPSGLEPAPGAQLEKPPVLRWEKERGARYYNVQLFRGRTKLLSAWPTRTKLQLRRSWTYRGRRHRLTRGHYRWYVWPGLGSRADHRYGALIGHSSFSIVRRP
jgi:hypothetical protein